LTASRIASKTMLGWLRNAFSAQARESQLERKLAALRQRTPVPVLWMFGKTQTGKTSIVKYLTGGAEAEIGQGFKPCTRFSREYHFPTPEAPLLTFLDTRGVDEPGYDPAEDLAAFNPRAHLVLVTVRVLDHALENLIRHLQTIRRAAPARPVIVALTCLHEAYPQAQHPEHYPFSETDFQRPVSVDGQQSDALARSLAEQQRRFDGVADVVVPIDLTREEEGFHDPNYGGPQLKKTLIELLPRAYRQTLLTLDESTRELRDLYARQALPHVLGYSMLAATAGAVPVPWLDLLILPAIQSRMIYHLAQLYGQPLSASRFLELASTLGLGIAVRQAAREVVKFIPYVGSVAGGILAGTSTFALGKAFCYYYTAMHRGHVPGPEELKRYYREELARAEQHWASTSRP
jgi:uncharacterized protein (DUF697 family)/predicted GTPase